jgi:hypothetical protein
MKALVLHIVQELPAHFDCQAKAQNTVDDERALPDGAIFENGRILAS